MDEVARRQLSHWHGQYATPNASLGGGLGGTFADPNVAGTAQGILSGAQFGGGDAWGAGDAQGAGQAGAGGVAGAQ